VHGEARGEPTLAWAAGLCLAAALAAAALLSRTADWQPVSLVVTVLVLAVGSDLLEADTKSLRLSGSFLALVLAMVLLGPAPAAAIGLVATAFRVAVRRPRRVAALVDVATCTVFPLLGGLAARLIVEQTGISHRDPDFLIMVFGIFVLSNFVNFSLIAQATSFLDGVSLRRRLEHDFLPVLPWEMVTALVTVAIVALYVRVHLPALVLAALAILTFQYLLRELLTSQLRAEELEKRTTQLATMQVGVLAAMVQTLGLRDRMTARHSAAVARFAREIASAAGRSEEEQELVHTAGLLHDIGKFALPDAILLGQRPLDDEDWVQIRRHPEDGARVVRRVDGYGPVADIVLLHHERLDGAGYPYGLEGDDIPLFARIIAVADAYDVMTARDSYRAAMTSGDACTELRRSAGSQFDPWVVETFIAVLERRDLAFRHADDADFERELGFDRRVQDFARGRP
jgi:putative nucleotidyltransferase with HDIG domain